jgi:hypothetical protein
MICIKCGQELDEGTKFCTKCGFGLIGTAPGNKFLKITGILFIVFGVFGIISLISSIVTSSMTGEFSELDIPEISGLTIFLLVLYVIFCLFLGITGIMYCNDLKKAILLKYFALGYIGFYIIYSINSIINSVTSLNKLTAEFAGVSLISYALISYAMMIIGIIIGFIIPILYFIGAQKNLKVKEKQ